MVSSSPGNRYSRIQALEYGAGLVLVSNCGENMTDWEFRITDVPHNTELLRGLKPREIDLILAAGRPCRFRAKSVMTYQGDPAQYLLLLWKGRARYFYEAPNDRKHILKGITPGQIFGGAALVSQHSTYLVSTEAVQDSIVLEWNGPTIRDFARRYPRLLENAHLIDMDYVSWFVATHTALTSQSARKRLASILFGLAKSVGRRIPGGIELDATNEELANSANITPYTASRLLSEWQRSGAIRKHRGKIVLFSPETFLGWPEAKLRARSNREKN
jgi:CRP/FNR family transcriptional regulator, nitrogen oxide reductase regulator